MELDQVVKRLEWLEDEHRKDKSTIAAFEQRMAAYEGNFSLIKEQLKELNTDLSRIASTSARIDQFDGLIAQYRSEVTKSIEEADKRRAKGNEDIEKRRRNEIDNFNKVIAEINKTLETLPEFRKGLQVRADEDARLSRLIAEAQNKVEDALRVSEDAKRSHRVLDEARKQDIKRITDLQGEFAAIRKRIDESREKADLNADSIKHLDTRINELLATEADRRQQQLAFIEQTKQGDVERERTWKEWQTRFNTFSKQTANLDEQIIKLEEMQRTVKRSQEAFDDINQRLERRINEITEMQRLAEDRFRQEWVSFKADDQKRWTNFSLSQDELAKDIRQNMDKISERVTALNDGTQTQADLIQQTTEVTEQQMQELMNWAHEWLSNYQRVMGRARPGK